ncbi:CAZyme family GH18 [Penicillium coprophilum]|uniref:CAZyme family GH18 n=1 Tax=Penicillium coprophilum TaxID=36646 RepID=UPI0023A77C7A|nr:CAZyme family GH18 [Penicillium coprophilum]KAJ5171524.1 CAZyme family GH18 [Penicillium coprophilum]
MASSSTGSGGNYCNALSVTLTLTGQEAIWSERKYCCEEDENAKWSDCQWYDYGGRSENVLMVAVGFCDNACPLDRVRIALDQHGGHCMGDGGRAKCCITKYTTVSKRSYNDAETRTEEGVKEFMENPSCGLDDYSFKRDLVGINYFSNNLSLPSYPHSLPTLERRTNSRPMGIMEDLAYELYILPKAAAAAREIWNTHVVSVYPNLNVETVRAYMSTDLEWMSRGSWNFVDQLICNMAFFNNMLGGSHVVSCKCTTADCCDPSDPETCSEDDDVVDAKRSLDKRARENVLELDDGNGNVVVVSWVYQKRGDIQAKDPILNAGYEYLDQDNCLVIDIGTVQIPISRLTRYQIRFLRDAHAGRLPSGATARNSRLSATFIRQALNAPILTNPPVMIGGDQSAVPISRAMQALGSTQNRADFTLLLSRLNNVKSRVWRAGTVTSDKIMKAAIKADDPTQALIWLREPLTIIAYLNHPLVNSHMVRTANIVRAEWGRAGEAWENAGDVVEYVQDWWDEWIRDSLKHSAAEVRAWVEKWAKEMIQFWAVRTGDQAEEVNNILASLRRLACEGVSRPGVGN